MESTVLPLMSALMTTRDPACEYVGTASDVTELNVDTTSGRAVSRPRAEVIASTAVMSACIAATIIGNVLVVLSVLTYRPLRGVMQNFYIVSLAVADLAVAHLALAHLAASPTWPSPTWHSPTWPSPCSSCRSASLTSSSTVAGRSASPSATSGSPPTSSLAPPAAS